MPMSPAPRPPRRDQQSSCKVCGVITGFDFSVSDKDWGLIVPDQFRDSVLCPGCLQAFALQGGVSGWEPDVRAKVAALARTHPKARTHLVPLLRRASGMVPPKPGTYPKVQAALKRVQDSYALLDQWSKFADGMPTSRAIRDYFAKSPNKETLQKFYYSFSGLTFEGDDVSHWFYLNFGPNTALEKEFFKTVDARDKFRTDLYGKAPTGLLGPLRHLLFRLRSYRKKLAPYLQNVMSKVGPARFNYKGFPILNPDRLSDPIVEHLLRGIDYLTAMFRKRGMEDLLRQGITRVVVRFQQPGDKSPHTGGPVVGWYHGGEKYIEFLHAAARKGKGRLTDDWAAEVFTHEFGHYVHMDYLHPSARKEWDSGWTGVEQAQKALNEEISVSPEERKRYWKMLEGGRGDLSKVRGKLKGLDKLKFHAWLSNPMLGGAYVTPKQLRWTRDYGTWLSDLLRDPMAYVSQYSVEEGYPPGEQEKRAERALQVKRDALGVTPDYDAIYHPQLPQDLIEKYRKEDKSVAQAIDALEVPSWYARTNEREDFAESFVAFLSNPGALSDTARFRMQRSLALSGLYGKPVGRNARGEADLRTLLVQLAHRHASTRAHLVPFLRLPS